MKTIVYVLCLLHLSYCKNLPSFIERCHRNDPNISACLIKNVELLRPRFLKGVPELYIPSFNPLIIPQASLDSGRNFNASFKRIRIYGFENFVIDDLKFDPKKPEFRLAITIPHARVKSEYSLKGRLLILQLDGNGPADGNFTNLKADIYVSGKHYTKNGKDYITLGEHKIDVDAGKPHLQFDEIFKNNAELNEQTNKLINENIEDIIKEIKPVAVDIIWQFVIGTTLRVFDKFSFDELFPE